MKILVFDDNEMHRKSAATLLKGHEVTIVGTYDEAQETFFPQTDYKKAKALFDEAGLPASPQGLDDTKRKEWYKAQDESRTKATIQPTCFDAVLTDLLVPASKQAQGPNGYKYIGQEMPLGTSIAFLALSKGVKLVAVVTDTSHHDHPASATFDKFRKVFQLGEAKVLLTNGNVTGYLDENTFEEVTYEFLESEEGKKKYPYDIQRYRYTGVVIAKAWHRVLAELTS